jgi:Replication-relaxation
MPDNDHSRPSGGATPPPAGSTDSTRKRRTPSSSTRRGAASSRAQQGDQPQQRKTKRATRQDKGMPRLELRDFIVLRWIMQMYCVRFDQLQMLLALHSPKREELEDPEHVSPSTVRTHLRRWKILGLVRYKKILAGKEDPLWCWLTPYGLRYLAFEEDQDGQAIVYTYYEPKPRDLPHIFLINQARLYIERQHPTYVFKSERQLRREQQPRPKHIKKPHLTDGLFYKPEPDGRAIALEVERYDKAGTRLKSILEELAMRYHRTWYFVGKKARTAINTALAELPESQRRRIQMLSAEAKLLGQPAVEQEEEVTEE